MGIFDQNDLQWGMLSNQSAPMLDAIGGLADMAGVSKKARAQQEADQIFGGGQQGGLFGQKQPVIKPREVNDIGTGELLRIYRNEAASPADREFAGTLLKQRLEPKKFDFLTAGKNVLRADPTTGQLDQVYTVPDAPMSELDRARLEQEKVQTELYRKQAELADRRAPDEFARREEVLRQQGIDPRSPEGQSFILYNKPPTTTAGPSEKPPSGYRWVNPNDPNSGLEAIPGGPGEAISGELAARLGLAKNFLEDAPDIKRNIEAGQFSGWDNTRDLALGINNPGRLYLRIESGTDALQRMLTGAGMPASEAAVYVRRYLPTWRDSDRTISQKFDQLVNELTTMAEVAARGRGGSDFLLPQGGAPAQGQPQPGRARILSVEPAQ